MQQIVDDQKAIEEEKIAAGKETTTTGLENVDDLDKIIDELNKPISKQEAEVKDLAEIKDLADLKPPKTTAKTFELTSDAIALLDAASTGGIPAGYSDKRLKQIAKQNGIEGFNPAIDTVTDLVNKLKGKIGVQDAERRIAETSGAGAGISGERTAADTEGATKLDGAGVGGDEGTVVTDKGAAGDEQLTLEEQEIGRAHV